MGKSGLYIRCIVTVAPRDTDAHSVYIKQSQSDNNKLGPAWDAVKGIRRVNQSNLLRWGENSSYIVFTRGLYTVGHFFTGQRGKRVIHVALLGGSVRTADAFGDLLKPIFDRLDKYNP